MSTEKRDFTQRYTFSALYSVIRKGQAADWMHHPIAWSPEEAALSAARKDLPRFGSLSKEAQAAHWPGVYVVESDSSSLKMEILVDRTKDGALVVNAK